MNIFILPNINYNIRKDIQKLYVAYIKNILIPKISYIDVIKIIIYT